MVNFWDTSAIVPLLVREDATAKREAQLGASQGAVVWWATRLECVSALCRRHREGILTSNAFRAASARLNALGLQWMVVSPSNLLLSRAERLLRVHPLRAADAMQLAAALVAVQEEPDGSFFHTADTHLAAAAEKEHFNIL